MRKLNTRERCLLIALAVGALAVWFVQRGDGSAARHTGDDARFALGDLGPPPVVRLELLDAESDLFDAQGRNLFAYYTPKKPVRPPRVVLSPPIPPPPPIPQQDTKILRDRASEPSPPQPTFDYIGLLGPKDDLFAVFYREAGVFVAQVGDVIDDTFELVDFRYGAVVLSLVDKEFAGSTVTLSPSQ